MPADELQQFFPDLYSDPHRARILWQVLIIGVAIAAGALASRLSRSYLKTRDTKRQTSVSGACWLAFPARAPPQQATT